MDHAITNRMNRVLKSQATFLEHFQNPTFAGRLEDPLACDFGLGNPQEMPLPGFVNALHNSINPQNKDWFAYKLNEEASRLAVASYLLAWRGVNYDPEDIFLTTGNFAGLAVCINAVVDPGDEVIFLSPPWFFYESLILGAGAEPVRVRVDPVMFDPDLEAIAAAITPRTRAIIINSPNNPTGRIYPPEVLKGLASVLTEANRGRIRPIYLISDEAYSRIVFDLADYPSPTTFYPHSFLVYTFGKTLLTPGQRIGYIALPPEMPERELMRRVIFNTQLVTGYAFPNALLQHSIEELNRLSISIHRLQARRDWFARELQRIGYKVQLPQGTFYLLPRSPLENDLALIDLLYDEHIYCLPGTVVEMPGYFRISLTASDEMISRSIPGFERVFQKVSLGMH